MRSLLQYLVEEPDFGAYVTNSLLKGTHMGPVIKHVNWALVVVNALPESFSGRWVPGEDTRRQPRCAANDACKKAGERFSK